MSARWLNIALRKYFIYQLVGAGWQMVTVFNLWCYRDLKSDNVLLDRSEGEGSCPTLAVTDFGCCLADKAVKLSMPFRTLDTNRGGNAALMAPEVGRLTT